jgi:hypothetical protein
MRQFFLLIENAAVFGMFVACGPEALLRSFSTSGSLADRLLREFGVPKRLGRPEFQSICKGWGGNPEIFTMRNL